MGEIVYISIGNSDDKLTQRQWHEFVQDCTAVLARVTGFRFHGVWFSAPSEPWQNACFCIEIAWSHLVPDVQRSLQRLARTYNQDSIAWTPARPTILLTPLEEHHAHAPGHDPDPPADNRDRPVPQLRAAPESTRRRGGAA